MSLGDKGGDLITEQPLWLRCTLLTTEIVLDPSDGLARPQLSQEGAPLGA